MRRKKTAVLLAGLSLFALSGCYYQATDIDRSFPEFAGTGGNLNSFSSYQYVERTSHKMLFIGNSFTFYNDLPGMVEKIGKELSLDITCKSLTKGSQKLIQSADSQDELGAKIEAEIASVSDYTDVVLQEQSTYPVDYYSSFLDGAYQLRDKIGRAEKDLDETLKTENRKNFYSYQEKYLSDLDIKNFEYMKIKREKDNQIFSSELNSKFKKENKFNHLKKKNEISK